MKAFSKAYVKSQDRGRDSLINEIQILQGLHHPNIMEAVEIHESSNSLYLVMELLEGGEICSFQKGKLDPESTLHILKSILKALVHLDIKGIMHRDLKPDNIIFKKKNCKANENTVKLVDFGLASKVDVDKYLFRRCGTPGFIAPEVINSKKEDTTMFSTKSDVFSTGVIFYFMLTGKIPYEGKNFQEVLESNQKAVIDFSIKDLASVSSRAMNLMRGMLELDPERRLSAAECLQHDYFEIDYDSESEICSNELDEGYCLGQTMQDFKEKLANKPLGGTDDSIYFKLNPTIRGETGTYNSHASPGTKLAQKIASINSPAPSNSKDLARARVSNVHSNIYKYVLTNGSKGI